MKKRTIALLTLLAVWSAIAFAADFNRDGGWLKIFKNIDEVFGPIDSVILVDTVLIINVQNDTIRMGGGEFAFPAPAQYGRITFHTGNNADTVRYFDKANGDASDDTLWLTVDLTVATANGDSAIVEWFSNLTAVDTVTQTLKEAPVFARNAFLTRITNLSNLDSTGVTFIGQTRVDDSGTWVTFMTTTLMAEGDSSVAFADTLSAANLFFGNQIQFKRIFVDSLGGVPRKTAVSTEVWWRGIR